MKCPNCGNSLNHHIDSSNDERQEPENGDKCICMVCGEPSIFKDGELSIPDEKEMEKINADDGFKRISFLIKSISQSDKFKEQYSDQLERMVEAARSWKCHNINLSPIIQYNFPKSVCLIASLNDAIKKSYISINDDARTMLEQLGWLDDRPDAPTVLMARTVLEDVFN